MPRRAKLAIAALLVVSVIVVGLGRRPRSEPAPTVTAARSAGDSASTPDSAAQRDSQPEHDPPCLASRIGLPCR